MRTDAHGSRVLQGSQPPEILFIERCVQLLKPGTGRMAIVVPNGILNNPALGYVRQWILENVQVVAVVDMARELFQPKNDTQTSMVLMRRLDNGERAKAKAGELDYETFMAFTEKVGKDRRGNPLYRRNEYGEEIVAIRREIVSAVDAKTGEVTTKEIELKELLIDDELHEAADAYLDWVRGER